MNKISERKTHTKLSRNVFRDPKKRKPRAFWKANLEAFIMITSGAALVYFLNWLPFRLNSSKVFSESIQILITSSHQLLISIINIISVLLLYLLILLSISLLIGGIIRITRAFIRYRGRSNISRKR